MLLYLHHALFLPHPLFHLNGFLAILYFRAKLKKDTHGHSNFGFGFSSLSPLFLLVRSSSLAPAPVHPAANDEDVASTAGVAASPAAGTGVVDNTTATAANGAASNDRVTRDGVTDAPTVVPCATVDALA